MYLLFIFFNFILTTKIDIVDIKPPNMEELTEVITSAQFHPQHCNIIMYSSSRGSIKLGDTRKSALCDVCAKVLEVFSLFVFFCCIFF